MVYTAGLALLVDTVGQDEIGAWIGFAFSGMSAGVMISPCVAGFVYAHAGYHAVFAAVLAIIGLDFVMQLVMIEKQAAQKWLRVDERANVFGVPQQSYGTTGQDVKSYGRRGTHPTSDVEGAAKIPPLESPIRHPGAAITDNTPSSQHSIPPYQGLATFFKETALMLKSRGILAAMYGGFIQTTIICAFDGILPIFVHKTFGWETSGGGSVFLALTIPSLVAPLVGTLCDRLGARLIVAAGFVVCILTLSLMGLVEENSLQQVVLLCALLASTGIYSLPIFLSQSGHFGHAWFLSLIQRVQVLA